MTDRSLTIPPNDARIHVLAARPEAGIETTTHLSRLRGEAPGGGLADALGAPVDPSGVEAFSAQDVESMGLRAYLASAHDADPGALETDAVWLDQLRGTVVVVTPKALPAGGTLTLSEELHMVGSYPTAAADHSAAALPRRSPDEVPRVATPGASTGDATPNRTILWTVLAALALAAILVLAL